MPLSLADYAKTINLPDGVSAEIQYWSDNIEIWRDGKVIGRITRVEIDDNLADKKLKEILGD